MSTKEEDCSTLRHKKDKRKDREKLFKRLQHLKQQLAEKQKALQEKEKEVQRRSLESVSNLPSEKASIDTNDINPEQNKITDNSVISLGSNIDTSLNRTNELHELEDIIKEKCSDILALVEAQVKFTTTDITENILERNSLNNASNKTSESSSNMDECTTQHEILCSSDEIESREIYEISAIKSAELECILESIKKLSDSNTSVSRKENSQSSNDNVVGENFPKCKIVEETCPTIKVEEKKKIDVEEKRHDTENVVKESIKNDVRDEVDDDIPSSIDSYFQDDCLFYDILSCKDEKASEIKMNVSKDEDAAPLAKLENSGGTQIDVEAQDEEENDSSESDSKSVTLTDQEELQSTAAECETITFIFRYLIAYAKGSNTSNFSLEGDDYETLMKGKLCSNGQEVVPSKMEIETTADVHPTSVDFPSESPPMDLDDSEAKSLGSPKQLFGDEDDNLEKVMVEAAPSDKPTHDVQILKELEMKEKVDVSEALPESISPAKEIQPLQNAFQLLISFSDEIMDFDLSEEFELLKENKRNLSSNVSNSSKVDEDPKRSSISSRSLKSNKPPKSEAVDLITDTKYSDNLMDVSEIFKESIDFTEMDDDDISEKNSSCSSQRVAPYRASLKMNYGVSLMSMKPSKTGLGTIFRSLIEQAKSSGEIGFQLPDSEFKSIMKQKSANTFSSSFRCSSPEIGVYPASEQMSFKSDESFDSEMFNESIEFTEAQTINEDVPSCLKELNILNVNNNSAGSQEESHNVSETLDSNLSKSNLMKEKEYVTDPKFVVNKSSSMVDNIQSEPSNLGNIADGEENDVDKVRELNDDVTSEETQNSKDEILADSDLVSLKIKLVKSDDSNMLPSEQNQVGAESTNSENSNVKTFSETTISTSLSVGKALTIMAPFDSAEISGFDKKLCSAYVSLRRENDLSELKSRKRSFSEEEDENSCSSIDSLKSAAAKRKALNVDEPVSSPSSDAHSEHPSSKQDSKDENSAEVVNPSNSSAILENNGEVPVAVITKRRNSDTSCDEECEDMDQMLNEDDTLVYGGCICTDVKEPVRDLYTTVLEDCITVLVLYDSDLYVYQILHDQWAETFHKKFEEPGSLKKTCLLQNGTCCVLVLAMELNGKLLNKFILFRDEEIVEMNDTEGLVDWKLDEDILICAAGGLSFVAVAKGSTNVTVYDLIEKKCKTLQSCSKTLPVSVTSICEIELKSNYVMGVCDKGLFTWGLSTNECFVQNTKPNDTLPSVTECVFAANVLEDTVFVVTCHDDRSCKLLAFDLETKVCRVEHCYQFSKELLKGNLKSKIRALVSDNNLIVSNCERCYVFDIIGGQQLFHICYDSVSAIAAHLGLLMVGLDNGEIHLYNIL